MYSEEDKAKHRSQIGTILEVSEFCKEKGLKTGDKIYYDKHSSFDAVIEGTEIWICKYKDVILVI